MVATSSTVPTSTSLTSSSHIITTTSSSSIPVISGFPFGTELPPWGYYGPPPASWISAHSSLLFDTNVTDTSSTPSDPASASEVTVTSGSSTFTTSILTAAAGTDSNPTPSPTQESTDSSASSASSGSGLSTGAKAGIGVGVGLGALVILALVVAVALLWRRTAKPPTGGESRFQAFKRRSWFGMSASSGSHVHEADGTSGRVEADGTDRFAEADYAHVVESYGPKAELDSPVIRHELPAHEAQSASMLNNEKEI